MFNFLKFFEDTNTGRRGRKDYAEDAKKYQEKDNVNLFSQHLSLAASIRMASFLSSFCIFFSALSAKHLRLLRPVFWLSSLALLAMSATAQTKFEGIGRQATPAEIKAWDIDVRPDFKGLPKGQGSVEQGEKIWEAQCTSCHGSFGESNEVFPPLAGYTTAKDVETGRVASLALNANAPTRTTMMKNSQISTLWDYINRAMPWTAPKSLKPDEVYALTAYMLNLSNVVPADFTLSNSNIAEVQKRIPNRNGKTTAHSLWPGTEFGAKQVWSKPDAQGSACMKNCAIDPQVASFIPNYARDAHGNLAEQSRELGGSRGAKTLPDSKISLSNQASPPATSIQNAPKSVAPATPAVATNAPATVTTLKSVDVMPTLQTYACIACHSMDSKLVGPSFKDIAAKQGKRVDATTYLAGKIKNGGQGVYGQIPMPAQSLSETEAAKVAQWLAQGAAK
jgi:S-disulfanyl-L-cysteine oxidoreductase SoxD